MSERRTKMLSELGIDNVLDLITTYPRRYIDRTRQADVSDLDVGDEAAVLAEVQSVSSRRSRQGRAMVELTVRDGTGRLHIVFFNQPWRAKQLEAGTDAIFFGKVTEYRGRRQMANPVVDVIAGATAERRTLRILPVYPASAKVGLTSWEIGAFVEEALARAGDFADPVPEELRTSLDLWGRTESFDAIHRPESFEAKDRAHRRLVFDELFRLQLALVLRRRAFEVNARAMRHDVSPREVTGGVSDTLVARFLSGLPYELTTAQRRALAVIVADMAGPFPMHRLLQGDVGSGKTVVAVAALLAAVQSGHQGALMVPTEVLAEQHFTAVRALLGDLEGPGGMIGGLVRVELLTSKVKGKARTAVLDGLASGDIGIVVGTHALLTEEVTFHSLGCVVIDEQHRFGVEQRATLRAKGADGDPDLLVMTATPIPRTAAMVIFGDLDLTTLDEMPPGRIPVTTVWLPGDGAADAAWDRVRTEVADGHRAFVVCPLVSESPRVEAKSATEEYERLSANELSGLRVGLMHGQMATAAREEVMERFRSGEVQVFGRDDGHRSRRRRPRGDGDGDRERRPLRHRAAAPAPRPRRPRPGRELVLPLRRRGRQRTPHRGGGVDRRLRAGRGRPAHPRRRHAARRPPEGPERPAPGFAQQRGRHCAARRRQAGRRVDRRRRPPAGGARGPERRGRPSPQ